MDVLAHSSALRSTNATRCGLPGLTVQLKFTLKMKERFSLTEDPFSARVDGPSMRRDFHKYDILSVLVFSLLSSIPLQGELKRRAWTGIPEFVSSLFIFPGEFVHLQRTEVPTCL